MKKSKALMVGILSLTLGLATLVGCDSPSDDSIDETSEPTLEWIDYANNGSVQLTLDYEGRDFFTDGVGQVTLFRTVDGDTAHFKSVNDSSGETIKGRFWGIDTPESTGKIQMWGKDASNFTKEKLEEANENGTIVISSAQLDYGTPNHDSTGERYVTLVWISLDTPNCPYDELVLLNLWIVQEGLSYVKNVTDLTDYATVFYAAQDQAEAWELCLWSDEIPESWPGDAYTYASLYELQQESALFLQDPDAYDIDNSAWNNVRVVIQGYVTGYSNHILYIQDYYDEDDDGTIDYYGAINIYVGMSAIPSKYTTRNAYIQVYGLCQITESYGLQITDTEGRWPTATSYSDEDCQVIYRASENEYHTAELFEYTQSELETITNGDEKYDILNFGVSVSDLLIVSSVYISSSSEITVYFSNCSFMMYVTFLYKGDTENNPNVVWSTEEQWVGKGLYVQGNYSFHITTSGNVRFQIIPSSGSDIVWDGVTGA